MPHLTDPTLNEYLDNALEARVRAQVETHLRQCDDCRARLESLQSLFAALDALPELELAHDLSAGVLEAVRPPAPAAFTWRLAAGLQTAFALLLIAIALPLVLQSQPAQIIRLSWQQALSQGQQSLLLLAARGTNLLQTLADLLAQYRSLPTSLPDLPVSPVAIWPLLIATGLLWLLGNGLLLRARVVRER